MRKNSLQLAAVLAAVFSAVAVVDARARAANGDAVCGLKCFR
jgi:hypothetical protein